MTEPEDHVSEAFAAFRATTLVRPVGLTEARLRSRRRRRRRAVVGALLVAVLTVPVVLAGIGLSRLAPSVVPVGVPTPPASTSPDPWPNAGRLPLCRGNEMSAKVVGQGEVAAHAYLQIALTNNSTMDCRLVDYVGLGVHGHRGLAADGGPEVTLYAVIDHGGLTVGENPSVRNVGLAPGQSAYFVVESATNADGVAMITFLWILFPYSEQPGPIPVVVRLAASGQAGGAIPLRITAVSASPIDVG